MEPMTPRPTTKKQADRRLRAHHVQPIGECMLKGCSSPVSWYIGDLDDTPLLVCDEHCPSR
jgi:hypothetical protein